MKHIHSQSTACCVNGFWLHEAEQRGQKEFCSVSSSPNGMQQIILKTATEKKKKKKQARGIYFLKWESNPGKECPLEIKNFALCHSCMAAFISWSVLLHGKLVRPVKRGGVSVRCWVTAPEQVVIRVSCNGGTKFLHLRLVPNWTRLLMAQ